VERISLRSSRRAEGGGIMLVGGKSRFARRRCSERREVSEVDENRAVVRRWIETFNNPYTPQTEVDVLAPGYIAHAPGLPGPLDLEAWTQFTAAFVEAFPDLRLTVEDIFSGGNMVAARVAFRGTHRGEFQGIPPTGKEVAFSSIEIDRMVDGKVAEHWFEMDLLGLMRQLGAIPEPEHSEEASAT
jgi:predicted ester cyclase